MSSIDNIKGTDLAAFSPSWIGRLPVGKVPHVNHEKSYYHHHWHKAGAYPLAACPMGKAFS
jgi:hypothetical protein